MKRFVIALIAATMTATSASSPIFEFGTGETTWFVRNDAVMGGVSSSRLRIDDGVLTFTGRVRLENAASRACAPTSTASTRAAPRA